MEWVKFSERPPDVEKFLAICVSEKDVIYNMRHDGWFRDTIYACSMFQGKVKIESHGPLFTPTHWRPMPEKPKE